MNLSSQLTQLEVVDLIRRLAEAEPAFTFKHPLTQASAYDSLLHRDRQALHHQVATVYEDMYPARLDDLAALLAHHYAEAHDDAKTLEFATRAGDVASRVYANAEAIAFYAQALDAAKRIGAPSERLVYLYTKRGRVLEVIGRNPEALATYEEMFEYAREHGDVALEMESLLLQGILHSLSNDRALALSLAKRGETLAGELGDRKAQARAMWIEHLAYVYSNEYDQALSSGERALAFARKVDATEILGYILGDLSRAYLQNENFEQVRALTDEARAIWRSLDNKPMLADNLMTSASRAYLIGDFDQAVALAREGIEISRAIDSKVSFLSSQAVERMACLDLGEFTSALQNVNESLREIESIIDRASSLPLLTAQLAWTYSLLGSYKRADEFAQTAREILKQPILPLFRNMCCGILAQYYLNVEDLDGAQTVLASGSHNENGIEGWLGASVFADYLFARGEFEQAAQYSEQEVTHSRQSGRLQALPDLLYVQAKSVQALGKNEQAIELLHQARLVAAKINQRRALWQIYALLSRMERERGNIPEAEQFQAKAREVIGFIVDHTPPELRDSFLAQPAVHAVIGTQ